LPGGEISDDPCLGRRPFCKKREVLAKFGLSHRCIDPDVPSGELIEVAAADPKLGIVFYTLEQKPGPRPKLVRDNRCLECHASAKTLNVPGLLARSFLTRDDGDVDTLSGMGARRFGKF